MIDGTYEDLIHRYNMKAVISIHLENLQKKEVVMLILILLVKTYDAMRKGFCNLKANSYLSLIP